MVLRFRVGSASSGASGHAMANYMEREALGQARSLYYAADAPDRADDRPRDKADRLTREADAFAEVRPDIDSRLATKLGIDTGRPLRLEELGQLLNGRRTDGAPIEGKQKRSESASLAETLSLDPTRLPDAEEVAHVLEGRRADGQALPARRAEGARRRFLEALGVPRTALPAEIDVPVTGREDTPEKPLIVALGHLVAGDNLLFSEALDTVNLAYVGRKGQPCENVR